MLFVVAHGLARGARASLAANAGILTGNSIYFALSALGLGAVLLASHRVFLALKYAGALYLIVLGIRTWVGRGLSLAPPRRAAEAPGAGTWMRATALQLANPKAIVFFAALLPQFVDASKPFGRQIVVLGATSVAIEFVVLAGYGYLAARAARVAHEPRFRMITSRLSGAILIAAGAGIALASAH